MEIIVSLMDVIDSYKQHIQTKFPKAEIHNMEAFTRDAGGNETTSKFIYEGEQFVRFK